MISRRNTRECKRDPKRKSGHLASYHSEGALLGYWLLFTHERSHPTRTVRVVFNNFLILRSMSLKPQKRRFRLDSMSDDSFPKFEVWYSVFRKYAMKCRHITLTSSFLEYLDSDGVFLPESTKCPIADDQLSDEDECSPTDESTSIENKLNCFDFPELDSQIAEAIAELNGLVFVKLNDAAPTDASWINTEGLKCRTPGEVYLLLKASSRIYEQDSSGLIRSNDTHSKLIIKKWANLHPAMEFRCFVRDKKMVAISQRDCSVVYDFLVDDQNDVLSTIESFYKANISPSAEQLDLSSFVLDVYLDKSKRLWILDLATFNTSTDSLLFSWEESVLSSAHSDGCIIRVVELESETIPSKNGSSRGPIDTVDIASGKFEGMFQYSKDAMNVRVSQSASESESD